MKKLRLIQCGVGGFGQSWLENYTRTSPDFELAALVDVSSDSLAEAGRLAGVAAEAQFRSLEEALDRVEADAVLTVTPPQVHVQHARQAFAQGLHVMTEKPISGTIEDAREMVKLASDAARHLVVSQQYRYRPSTFQLRELLQSGTIGQLGHGHLEFYIPADFTGSFRETMEFPLLIDMAIHHVDLIRAVTGRNIVSVVANSFNPPWSWYRHDAGLKMILELEGGIPFSYSGDWSALGPTTSWNGRWRLQGSEGSLHHEKDTVLVGRSGRWGAEESLEAVALPVFEREGQAETLHRFAVAIRTGVPAETSGSDNLQSLIAVSAAIRSILENRKVLTAEFSG